MKKILTTTIIALSITTTAFSQAKNITEISAFAGYNAATVSGSIINSKHRAGFVAGLSGDHYFSDRWSLLIKLFYDQKGWGNGYISTPTTITYTDFHVDYLTLPVLAEWHFGATQNWYLNFGPYASILLNASATAVDYPVKDFFSSIDAGLDLGIGVKFPVADQTKFFVELNGEQGVSDLFKNNQGTAIHNSLGNLSVGLKF